ncbi:MAG TPA: helix-turn-helix transcriptional regulator [Halanaerobiales bacterium]|nr:helix-turn-helix transcriptional regulator [Halanaerobiales bacterium]
MSIGKIIKELRKENNMTQEDLAEKLGITRGAIGLYERGERKVNYETVNKLADIFGVSSDYLLGRIDKKNPVRTISEAISDNPELYNFWKELSKREDLQLLFKQTRDLEPKEIKRIIRVIKAIEDEEIDDL